MLKIYVPATSANLGPGFDSVGLALDLYNTFYIYDQNKAQPPGTILLPANSLAHKSIDLLARQMGKKEPRWNIAISSTVPRARGLGSSATLTVGGLVGANVLFDGKLGEEELVSLATRIEGHADNAAPALVGGLVITMATPQGIKFIKVLPSKELQAVIAVPDFELSTSTARKVLPRKISHQDAVHNTGRMGFFLAAILRGDYRYLSLAMEDMLHQPYRSSLVPGLAQVMKAANNAGALGSCLSGAGPSILAFCTGSAGEVSSAMKETWQDMGISSRAYILNIDQEGTRYSYL